MRYFINIRYDYQYRKRQYLKIWSRYMVKTYRQGIGFLKFDESLCLDSEMSDEMYRDLAGIPTRSPKSAKTTTFSRFRLAMTVRLNRSRRCRYSGWIRRTRCGIRSTARSSRRQSASPRPYRSRAISYMQSAAGLPT